MNQIVLLEIDTNMSDDMPYIPVWRIARADQNLTEAVRKEFNSHATWIIHKIL